MSGAEDDNDDNDGDHGSDGDDDVRARGGLRGGGRARGSGIIPAEDGDAGADKELPDDWVEAAKSK